MAFFVVHLWVEFLAGTLTGCWIGVVIGCGVTLFLMGRRVRQLEGSNRVLRNQLRAAQKPQRTGTGGPLVMTRPVPGQAAAKPFGRMAGRF